MRESDIHNRFEAIPKNIASMEFLQAMEFQELYVNFQNIGSILYRLQYVIQSLIDLGNYIIDHLGLKLPNFNIEIINILTNVGLVSCENQERYIRVLKFGNQAEYLYKTIDIYIFNEMIYKEIDDVRILYEIFYKIIKVYEDYDCYKL